MPFYKVVRGEVSVKTKMALSVSTVWEGTDLGDLAKKFPRKYFTNGNNYDLLRGIRNERTITATGFLMREREFDEWQIIEDPRPIIGAIPHGASRTLSI